MNSSLSFCIALLIAWLPQVARDGASQPASGGTAVVEGRVTIAVNETPQPVRRARLTLESDSSATHRTTDTDTDGRYRFEGVMPGRYRIRAEKYGFVPNAPDPQRALQPSSPFVLADGQSLSLDLGMVRAAALEGRIQTDAGEPVVDAVVYAMRSAEGANDKKATAGQARTDDRGRFRIHTIPAGDYSVEAAVPGSKSGQTVSVGQGLAVAGLDFTVPTTERNEPQGPSKPLAIEGWVLDEFGDPAPGMRVQAARAVYASGKKRFMMVSGGTSLPTDDLGKFRIPNLQPSEYYLVVPGQFADSQAATGLAVTYYPGTVVPSDASPLSVVGQEVTDITFRMIATTLSTLSGIVTDETGTPIEAGLALVPTSGGDVHSEILRKSQSNADGSFVIPSVPEGSYALQAFSRRAFGAIQLVVAGDMRGLVVKTAPGVTLRGRVIFEGTARPDPSSVRFNPAPLNFATGPVAGGPADSVTNSDWTFEVKNMVGTRAITAPMGTQGWMLKSVVREGKDITDQPIEFRDQDVEIVVTLTSNLSLVSGTVTDGNKPVPDCQVIIFSDNATKWAYPSRHIMSGRSDARGTFAVSGLPPGSYLAIAIPLQQAQTAQAPAGLEQLRAFATSVTVHEGTASTVALRVVRR